MTRDRQRQTEGFIALALFALTIPAANWLIGNAGAVCVPNGPCLVPVWPGIMAPSGVLMVGLALVLRDIVQRRRFVTAVFASSVIGLVVDSLVFLHLAFGSLDFLAGQIIGKAWMVLLALPLMHLLRRRDERLGLVAA